MPLSKLFSLPKLSSNTTQSKFKLGLFLTAGVLAAFGVAHYRGQTYSANLTGVSVTSNNVRPSFRGALAAGNVAGTSTVVINTTANAYASTSSAQLVEGDVIRIGSAGTLRAYTVASTSSLANFSLTAALLAGDADAGDDVIATSSATLNVRFTTASAINDGKFRVLIPSIGGAAALDGIPDGGGFDYGTLGGPTVTCPADFTNYTFGAGAKAGNAVTLNGQVYHSVTCAYTGTGDVGSVFNGTTHDYITIAGLINPAPAASHTSGTADAYSVIVQHLDSSNDVIDFTTARVAIVEAVKVTAYVSPQITFKIFGLPTSTSACGAVTDVDTTPVSVPFGELTLGNFRDAAQAMSVSTNATGGYAVTATENDQIGRNGGACTGDPTTATNGDCIQDVRGDAAGSSNTVSDEWNATTSVGFGYSLSDLNGTVTEAFAYNESARTFSARQFADGAAGDAPVTIFSDSTVTNNDNIYVCYRILPDATTAAGNYENYITYTATATF